MKNEERTNDSSEELDSENISETCEKLNEWSKPVKGGQRVRRAKDKNKASNEMASNRIKFLEENKRLMKMKIRVQVM